MKNLRGIIVAAVFAALSLLLQTVARHFDVLLDMAYPFFSKTAVEFLGSTVGGSDVCLWQVILAVYLAAVVVTLGLMILFRWNVFRWLGWVLAPAAIVYFLFTALWGLNYYNRPINESMKLEVPDYTVADLQEAAQFYGQRANRLSTQVSRDSGGNVELPTLAELNQAAEEGYNELVWNYSIFAGSRGPVKALGWSSKFSAMGIDGVTVALTGEAAVNLEQYASRIPFNVCHEIAHLLAIAREDEANFAGFLACEASGDPLFQYSGYLEAFLYCANALYDTDRDAWEAVWQDMSQALLHDVEQLNQVAAGREGPVQDSAQAVHNSYLQSNGQAEGIESYGQVTDLLVAWYQDQYVEDDTPEPTRFDPYNYDEVFPENTTEAATEATEEG